MIDRHKYQFHKCKESRFASSLFAEQAQHTKIFYDFATCMFSLCGCADFTILLDISSVCCDICGRTLALFETRSRWILIFNQNSNQILFHTPLVGTIIIINIRTGTRVYICARFTRNKVQVMDEFRFDLNATDELEYEISTCQLVGTLTLDVMCESKY